MTVQDKLKRGQSVLGSFVFSSDPAISEIYAEAGFDFCVIDLEHAPNDVPIALQHIRACEARGIEPIIRVGQTTEADIPRLLDAGAAGIMLPHFGMANQASGTPLGRLRYPPAGSRPTCTGIRAASYGVGSFADYVARSNRNVFGIGLVEDGEAIDRIDDLVGMVDCVMPGPGDLASSLGFHGQFGHPRVVAAVDRVLASAHRSGVIAGMYVGSPADIPNWHAKGARLFVMSIDYKVLSATLASSRQEFERIVDGLGETAASSLRETVDTTATDVDAA